MNSREASRLLEVLLVFSAGLCRTWKRTAILETYPSLFEFQNIYRRVDDRLLRSCGTFSITDIERLTTVLLQYRPQDLIIVTAHHGHFIAFIDACVRQGIPLAFCYKAASQPYLDSAKRSRVRLIDLNGQPNVLSLFNILDRERSDGHYVVIMMDGPFASRRRYDFLGYHVAASSLAPLYAQKTRSPLLPVVCTASPDLELSVAVGALIENAGIGTTQQLINFLQSVILQNPFQYQWLANSILMSDPSARDNAIRYLPDALTWRRSQA